MSAKCENKIPCLAQLNKKEKKQNMDVSAKIELSHPRSVFHFRGALSVAWCLKGFIAVLEFRIFRVSETVRNQPN